MAWRSASVAIGTAARLDAGALAAGPAALMVVWPFASMDREKMTLPAGGLGRWGGLVEPELRALGCETGAGGGRDGDAEPTSGRDRHAERRTTS